jgi:hypothetical protein
VTALYFIVWAVLVAMVTWIVASARTSVAISRLRAEMQQRIADWRDEAARAHEETERARAVAAQLARDAEIRAEAWTEGRNDVIAIMPLISSAQDGGASARVTAHQGTEAT